VISRGLSFHAAFLRMNLPSSSDEIRRQRYLRLPRFPLTEISTAAIHPSGCYEPPTFKFARSPMTPIERKHSEPPGTFQERYCAINWKPL